MNDINGELIHAYSILRKTPKALYRAVCSIPASSTDYYRVRRQRPLDLKPLDRAARFFYLNRHCFNGIYRTNMQGNFNVPYATHGTGGVPELDRWIQNAKMLSEIELVSEDFEVFLDSRVRAGDFVYLDPPYAVSNRRVFSQYSAQTFGLSDIDRLYETLKEIDKRSATFLVSYAQSPETKVLTKGWNVSRGMTQRNVAGFAEHRRKAVEVLISNFEPKTA